MALIFQCLSCRALTSAGTALVDDASAALVCGVCGAANRLPRQNGRATNATVVDVNVSVVAAPALAAPTVPVPATPQAPAAVAPVAPATAAAPASPAAALAPSAALVPAAPAAPIASFFTAEQLDKVRLHIGRAPPTNDRQVDLAAHFERLLQAWASAEGHKAILQKASAAGELAFLGGSYRAVLQAAPNDAAAKKGQNDLLALAMAQLSPNTGDMMAKTSSAKNWMVAGFVVLCALVAVGFLTMRTGSRKPKGDVDSAPEAQP